MLSKVSSPKTSMLPAELSTSVVPAYVTLSDTSSNYAYDGSTFGSNYSLLAAVGNSQMWKGSDTRVVYVGGDFVISAVPVPAAAPVSAPSISKAPTVTPVPFNALPGSICIVEINTVNPDEIILITFVPIVAGSLFYITDDGWTGSAFTRNEGTLTCTMTEDLAVGNIFNASTSNCEVSGKFGLSESGDQV